MAAVALKLSPSHRPPLPPRRRVYPLFPPRCVASEKLLFADLQRNDSECAKILTLLSLGATARPKGYARRCCACLCRNGSLVRRRPRYRVIGAGKAPDPVASIRRLCRETRSSAARALACPRLFSERVRMTAIGQRWRSWARTRSSALPQQADYPATSSIIS